MSQDARPNPIAIKTVVYTTAAAEAVTARRDEPYAAEDAALTMDLYYPPDRKNASRLPAVVVVAGYPDGGAQKMLGCKFKDMGGTVSWGRLTAASGMVAVTYTNREPVTDIRTLLQHVRKNGAALGIDENKIGVLACSGHVPVALSVLMREARDYVKCAVLCYGYMLDVDGFTGVAEAAKQFGFVNASAGTSVEDLPPDLPLFIARAGRDELPFLKEGIDRFLAKAVAANLPVTFVNHHVAPHAFDLLHDSEASREIVRRIVEFMRFHLGA